MIFIYEILSIYLFTSVCSALLQYCSFQSQVKFVFMGQNVDRWSSLDSDSEVSADLDVIIVNFDVQRRHTVSPSHWLAFSSLLEEERNIGFQKEFVSFSVVLPAGPIDDKIDHVLKEIHEKRSLKWL